MRPNRSRSRWPPPTSTPTAAQRSNRALELRVERARYEAIRAERAFHACEPDNRLVARSLENRWEEKLRDLKDAEAELAEHVVPAVEPSREQLEALARDLPALWAAKSTSDRDRKRLLRALIADITLTSQPEGRELRVGIRWRSGASEQHTVQRPPKPADAQRTPSPAVELTRRLAPEHTNAQIAEQLNASRPAHRERRAVRRASRQMAALALPDPDRPRAAPERWRGHRRAPRRAARRLAQRRLRLDLNRQAHRPPRARQPALHPVPAGDRATMPPAGH